MSMTINDIANKAGVSLATVSRVLNNSGYVSNDTRKKVMEAVEQLGYIPNGIERSFSKNEASSIAILVPDITNSYFGEIIKGISEVAEEKDLNVILFNTDDNLNKELRALKTLKTQKIKGIIMTPGFGGNDFNSEYLNMLETPEVPLVLVAASIKYSKFNGVFVDNIKGAFDAANYFIKEGHTNIGIITGNLNSEPAMNRLIGYKKALAYNNIEFKEEFVFEGDYKMSTSYEITKEILKYENRPTALLISSNMMTLGCIKAVLDFNKKIPEDLAIIGFDKMEMLDLLGLGISYVDDSPEELGRIAITTLLEVIERKNSKEIKEITISPKLILKGSEKKINK